MKLKTTKKAIRESGKKVIKVGYCGLQTLLRYQSPFAYSTGAEGWACDYYEIDEIIISTGYIPIGEKIDHKLISSYEDKARSITTQYSYGDLRVEIEKLLNEFIKNLEV